MWEGQGTDYVRVCHMPTSSSVKYGWRRIGYYHSYYIYFHISVRIWIRIRILSTIPDRIRLDVDIIYIRFTDIQTRIWTDLNPSKRIQSRIRSKNIRTLDSRSCCIWTDESVQLSSWAETKIWPHQALEDCSWEDQGYGIHVQSLDVFCWCRNRAILSIDIVRMSDGWAANSFRTSLRSERKQDYPQTPAEDAH